MKNRFKIIRAILDYLIINFIRVNRQSNNPLDIRVIFNDDLISTNILVKGMYERDYLEIVMRFITENTSYNFDSAIDIGANIGNHTVFFSNRFKNVYSFEPNPITFALLELNVRNKPNIMIFNNGISAKKRKTYMKGNRNNMGGFFVTDQEADFQVDLFPLETFYDLFTNVDLIKVDVEGMEIEVITSSEFIINEYRPAILFEKSFKKDLDKDSTAFYDFFKSKKYRLFEVRSKLHSTKENLLRLISILKFFVIGREYIDMIEISEFKDFHYTMLIGIPEERLKGNK